MFIVSFCYCLLEYYFNSMLWVLSFFKYKIKTPSWIYKVLHFSEMASFDYYVNINTFLFPIDSLKFYSAKQNGSLVSNATYRLYRNESFVYTYYWNMTEIYTDFENIKLRDSKTTFWDSHFFSE